jgi:hypothetical protein
MRAGYSENSTDCGPLFNNVHGAPPESLTASGVWCAPVYSSDDVSRQYTKYGLSQHMGTIHILAGGSKTSSSGIPRTRLLAAKCICSSHSAVAIAAYAAAIA